MIRDRLTLLDGFDPLDNLVKIIRTRLGIGNHAIGGRCGAHGDGTRPDGILGLELLQIGEGEVMRRGRGVTGKDEQMAPGRHEPLGAVLTVLRNIRADGEPDGLVGIACGYGLGNRLG